MEWQPVLTLWERARVAYAQAGRGMVVSFEADTDDTRYVLPSEIVEQLGGEPAFGDLVAAMCWAAASYDPETEAAVAIEDAEGWSVLIVREDGAQIIGTFVFRPLQ